MQICLGLDAVKLCGIHLRNIYDQTSPSHICIEQSTLISFGLVSTVLSKGWSERVQYCHCLVSEAGITGTSWRARLG